MFDFPLKKNILYVIDLSGVLFLDKENSSQIFFDYPEAAVLFILMNGYDTTKTIAMLEAILSRNTTQTISIINDTIDRLVKAGFI